MKLTLNAVLLCCGALFFSGCVNVPRGLFGSERGPMEPHTVVESEKGAGDDVLLMIDLTGTVSSAGQSGGVLGGSKPGMLTVLMDRLKAAESNPAVAGLILRINSPGGGVTASDVIHHELERFKAAREKKTGKAFPVVALMEDVAASGGVYIAMAADEIYALPTTTTGSIGVIAMFPGFEGLSEKVGVDMRVIKSGELKDMGNPWRDMTEEERGLAQEMIGSMYERFLDVIVASREGKGLTRELLREKADGRIYTAQQAKSFNLIDEIGYLDEVVERARGLSRVPGAAVITYEYPYAYRGHVYASGETMPRPVMSLPRGGILPPQLNERLDASFGPGGMRFMYLWLP